jgi:hypothetical protein
MTANPTEINQEEKRSKHRGVVENNLLLERDKMGDSYT